MSYTVSHFEIRAHDQAAMEKFYTEVMGFIVSDRGRLTAGAAQLDRSREGYMTFTGARRGVALSLQAEP